MGERLTERANSTASRIEVPAPTAWPLVLALGLGLAITGMVTSPWVALVGGVLFLLAARGWFLEVFPHERHELVAVSPERIEITRSKHKVARLGRSSAHQQVKPIERFSLLTGLKGGAAGGIAMIVPAVLYGVLRYHSPWYAVNLLAAGGFPSWANQPPSFFAEFHWKGVVAASIIHGVTAPLVGLLYAAILPMFPKRPIVTAGFVVPLFWTAMLYSVLGLISPVLNQRIDWLWFLPSQLAFGLVTGFVVNRTVHVRSSTFQDASFAERAGLHTDVTYREDHEDSQ